jgi:hypothetical protein
MNDRLRFEDLEKAYDMIAAGIDDAGPDCESLFLAKLSLALAHHVGNLAVVEQAIADAHANLHPSPDH